MSSPYLPPEILDLILTTLSTSELFACALVSKDWRSCARKRIWSQITIRCREKLIFVMSLLKEEEWLQDSVNKLKLVYSPSRKSGRETAMEGKEELMELVDLLPSLVHLDLDDNPPLKLHGHNFQTMLSLKSFTYYPSLEDSNFDVLRQVLGLASNISSLQLQIPWDFDNAQLDPLSQCPKLHRLELRYRGYAELFKGTGTFFPIGSLLELKEFIYYPFSGWDIDLTQFAHVMSSTLESLELRAFDLLDFELLGTTIYDLKGLKSVNGNLCKVPDNFLNIITSTITHLYLDLPWSTWQYFQLHPRPELKLKIITLSIWKKEAIPYLPDDVEVLRVAATYGWDQVMEDLEDVQGKLRNFKKIEFVSVIYLTKELYSVQKRAGFRRRFKQIGIDMVVKEWYRPN